jgi:hypothetical protein
VCVCRGWGAARKVCPTHCAPARKQCRGLGDSVRQLSVSAANSVGGEVYSSATPYVCDRAVSALHKAVGSPEGNARKANGCVCVWGGGGCGGWRRCDLFVPCHCNDKAVRPAARTPPAQASDPPHCSLQRVMTQCVSSLLAKLPQDTRGTR